MFTQGLILCKIKYVSQVDRSCKRVVDIDIGISTTHRELWQGF